MKSGSLNLLESSGPVQACNGIALPLPECQSKCCMWYLLYCKCSFQTST